MQKYEISNTWNFKLLKFHTSAIYSSWIFKHLKCRALALETLHLHLEFAFSSADANSHVLTKISPHIIEPQIRRLCVHLFSLLVRKYLFSSAVVLQWNRLVGQYLLQGKAPFLTVVIEKLELGQRVR